MAKDPAGPPVNLALAKLRPEKDDFASHSLARVEVYRQAFASDPGRVPPVRVAPEGGEYRIVDGHHRFLAARRAKRRAISAPVVE